MTVIIPDAFRAMSHAALKREAKERFGVDTLLARPEANPKLAKGMKIGVMSAPLHLAPYDLSGYQVCPMATAGCAKACLHTAGNPAHMSGKERARIARTKLYFEDRPLFMVLLWHELRRFQKKAEKAGMKPGVRLNATSDIPWERVTFGMINQRQRTVFDWFPDISFYDYTKRPNRRDLPANYHVTFSLAEGNDRQALEALKNGLNVAVVFDTKRGQALPRWFQFDETFGTGELHGHTVHPTPVSKLNLFEIVDGDEHDYRPADPKGVIVGLRAKGDAIGDTSGFVRAAPDF